MIPVKLERHSSHHSPSPDPTPPSQSQKNPHYTRTLSYQSTPQSSSTHSSYERNPRYRKVQSTSHPPHHSDASQYSQHAHYGLPYWPTEDIIPMSHAHESAALSASARQPETAQNE